MTQAVNSFIKVFVLPMGKNTITLKDVHSSWIVHNIASPNGASNTRYQKLRTCLCVQWIWSQMFVVAMWGQYMYKMTCRHSIVVIIQINDNWSFLLVPQDILNAPLLIWNVSACFCVNNGFHRSLSTYNCLKDTHLVYGLSKM